MAKLPSIEADVRDYLENVSPGVRECRADRHAMRRTHKGYIQEGRGREAVWVKKYECITCGITGRREYVPYSCEPLGPRKIDYAEFKRRNGYDYLGHGFRVGQQAADVFEAELTMSA